MAIPAGGVVVPVREPGNVSLLCPKLTTTNYTAWSIMMETVLATHGLQEAIDPTWSLVKSWCKQEDVNQKERYDARPIKD
ncbi:hypothetical protein E3N88_35558 [Mikania micrantha]|uniref:DUF4219 domain-containing protein n=1 Tax=Mikania micrantha TaxID=192012 RepID=A0A5N6M1F1_9ASTR|nr:hypothetical protein E3N88_35558 [Mikania micrantha]